MCGMCTFSKLILLLAVTAWVEERSGYDAVEVPGCAHGSGMQTLPAAPTHDVLLFLSRRVHRVMSITASRRS